MLYRFFFQIYMIINSTLPIKKYYFVQVKQSRSKLLKDKLKLKLTNIFEN